MAQTRIGSDPFLIDKVRNIVGLYLDPPHRTAVSCVDEKSKIRALTRTQPVLSFPVGQLKRRTCDYKKHGVITLMATHATECMQEGNRA
jgi:hypothetical protein